MTTKMTNVMRKELANAVQRSAAWSPPRHLQGLLGGDGPASRRKPDQTAVEPLVESQVRYPGRYSSRQLYTLQKHVRVRRQQEPAAMRSRRHPLRCTAARALLPTSAVGLAAGGTPWRNCSHCRRNTRLGSRRCRTAYRTPPQPRRWQPSSNWTSMDLPARNCPAATGATDAAQPGRRIQVTRREWFSVPDEA